MKNLRFYIIFLSLSILFYSYYLIGTIQENSI